MMSSKGTCNVVLVEDEGGSLISEVIECPVREGGTGPDADGWFCWATYRTYSRKLYSYRNNSRRTALCDHTMQPHTNALMDSTNTFSKRTQLASRKQWFRQIQDILDFEHISQGLPGLHIPTKKNTSYV
jgi:hypothetical protein